MGREPLLAREKEVNERDHMVVDMYVNEEMSTKEIGQKLSVTAERVRQILAQEGVPRRRSHHRNQRERDRETLIALERIVQREATRAEEAERLGLTMNGLESRFKRRGLRTGRTRIALHGERSMYVKGCRCNFCTRANTLYMRELRHRRKQREETHAS